VIASWPHAEWGKYAKIKELTSILGSAYHQIT